MIEEVGDWEAGSRMKGKSKRRVGAMGSEKAGDRDVGSRVMRRSKRPGIGSEEVRRKGNRREQRSGSEGIG